MLRRSVGLVACLLLPLAACSSSSKHASATTTTAGPTTTSSTVKIPSGFNGGDLAAFCTAWKDLKASAAVPAGTSPQQIKDHYAQVGLVARRLQAAAPSQVKAAVDVAVRINDQVATSGSTDAFNTDENKTNGSLIAAYADKNCPAK